MSDFFDPYLYDLKIGPSPRVSQVYLAEAKRGGSPILELGCGTGDVLLSLAEGGFKVIGIDVSASMLKRCKEHLSAKHPLAQQRVELVEGRMESFHLSKTFNQIFIPNDTIALLLDEQSLKSTFGNCYRHLVPGGRLVFDVGLFDVEYLGRFASKEREILRDRGRFPLSEGGAIQVWEQTGYDPASGILSAVFRYEFLDENQTVIRTYYRRLRLCPRRLIELTLALEISGFINIEVEEFPGGETGAGWIIRAYKAA